MNTVGACCKGHASQSDAPIPSMLSSLQQQPLDGLEDSQQEHYNLFWALHGSETFPGNSTIRLYTK